MDWRIYHAVNTFVSHHSWIGSIFRVIETYGTILIGVAAVGLWLLARPGGDRKWKLVSGSALGAAALGFVVHTIIVSIWHRGRPYQTHHVAHIWGPHTTDASFPSDHATASFSIAVAVALLDPFAGAIFLVLAVLISVGRVIVGVHYPGDVIAGAAVGTICALVVVRLGRPAIDAIARVVERVTDPIVVRVRGRVSS